MEAGGGADEQTERMRAGVRARIARVTQTTGDGLQRWSPPVLLGVLCAGAFGPLLAASAGVAGTGAALVAGIGVAGSVGGNALADVIQAGIGRLRDGGQEPTREEIEEEVEQRIQEILGAGGLQARQLRGDIARVLREIGAASAALEQAVRSGDQELQAQLTSALAGLGDEFAEFRFLLVDVSAALAAIQDDLNQQGSEQRLIIDLLRRQATHTRLMREDVLAIEHRSRSGDDGDPNGPQRSAPWLEGCPYRGLSPFEEDQAEAFYGRERVTAELVGTLAERLVGLGLVVVTGASGVGKSSLLRAGLLPALARGSLSPSSAEWPRRLITPTRAPLQELATQLAVLSAGDPTVVCDSLAEHPDQAHLLVRQAILADAERNGVSAEAAERHRLVLLVDQFEEIFTLGQDQDEAGEAQRSAFITALHAAAGTPCGSRQQPPALVVIAIRGDFLDRCAAYPRLREAMPGAHFIVGPMAEPDLRRAITGPAAAAGLRIEPGLTDTVLADLRSGAASEGYETGALPWLSHAMLITWEHREDGRLTSRGYGLSGGVRHAIQTSAEAVYADLGGAQQDIAAAMFQEMVVVARDGRLARRRRTRTSLYAGRAGAERDSVDAVLEAFAAKRLVVLSGETAGIAHDELLRAWPRLRAWLEPDLAGHILYGQILDDAAEWARNHQDPSFLYRGTQLAAVLEANGRWETGDHPLTGTAREFLDASTHAARRRLRQRRAVLSTLAALLVVAITAAATAIYTADDADHQRVLAVSRQLATESQSVTATDPVTSALLAAAAWRIAPTAEARYSMLTALQNPERGTFTGHTGAVRAVAFSPDGKILATSSSDGSARLWDRATGYSVGESLYSGGSVNAIAFNPDGGHIITGSNNGSLELGSARANSREAAFFARNGSGVYGVAFSPDGRTVVTAGADHTARLWDFATHRPVGKPFVGHTNAVSSVAFSPDGRTLATGSYDRTARLWDTATHRPVGKPFVGHTNAVSSVAFSPDGKTLATAGGDFTARLWDTATHSPIGAPLTGHTAFVAGVAFSPDGKTLATASGDQTARLWDVATHRQVDDFVGSTNGVTAFSPDGQTLATASAGTDHTARLWDVATHHQVGAPFVGHTKVINAMTFSPDGRTLATASTDQTARLWDVATQRQIGTFNHHSGATLEAVAFSSDGKRLATAGSDNTARLWDVATQRQIGDLITGFGDNMRAVAFSPDGKILVAASNDNTAQLWDIATREIITQLRGHTGVVNSVAFSPDGKTLATVSNDGTARLWDIATYSQIGAPFTGHTSYVDSVAFSPDGRTLATGSADYTARLWDVAMHRQIGAPLIGHTGYVYSVAFSPDGRTLATAGYDHTVRLWNVGEPADLLSSICAVTTRSFTHAEWRRYVPGEKFRQVCPQ
ncbi:hypothetical protein GCM10027176_69570 [Actinoallomurus bryophytorum]|uniref:WD40 repeat protein n=2 Tax=Actinoallomurus bryophytorum TaxID=1490222 RepID=A0A543CU69_9ACTN|nr:WD40 repeat protein [Actinoallomurus bryophytorum]